MMRRSILFSPVLAALAACSDGMPAPPAPGTPQAAAWEAALRPREGDYLLGPGDKLRVVVFNEEQLTGEHTVDPNGTVNVPLAGSVRAQGQTATAVAREIGRRLRESNYLRDPNVTVQVVETRPFYVLGEVQRPGEFRYRPGLSAQAAVAMAGGFTFRANQRRVLVAREGFPGEIPVETSAVFVLQPGDVLRVVERFL